MYNFLLFIFIYMKYLLLLLLLPFFSFWQELTWDGRYYCELENICYIADYAYEYEVKWTEEFKQKYSSYAEAKNYCFAFKIIIDWVDYWYYDVFRNINWWVSNDSDFWLNWCVAWSRVDWYTIYIPAKEQLRFARKEFWYEHKTLPIWLDQIQISPIKELSIEEMQKMINIQWRSWYYCN